MQCTVERRGLRAAIAAVVLAAGAIAAATTGAFGAGSSTRDGITRTALAQTTPTNVPGQELYLQRVRIAPGAELAAHFHEGTQVASIRSGVLTYDVISGTVVVTRADGSLEELTGPVTISLRKGDALTETEQLVHFGSNRGTKSVVVLLAALLAEDAPLATPVDDA